MNLSFQLDIFGLNDLSMNLIDLVLAFSLTQWSPYKAIMNVFRALTSHIVKNNSFYLYQSNSILKISAVSMITDL